MLSYKSHTPNIFLILQVVGIEAPSRASSPSLRIVLSSISGNHHHSGNMAVSTFYLISELI